MRPVELRVPDLQVRTLPGARDVEVMRIVCDKCETATLARGPYPAYNASCNQAPVWASSCAHS